MTPEEKQRKAQEDADAEAAEASDTADTDTEGDEEAEEEGAAEEKSSDKDIDLDAELENERKAAGEGKPDPKLAADAFKKREEKRKQDEEADDTEEDNRPLTRKDAASLKESLRAEMRQEMLVERALEIAKGMAGSDKEAALIVEKWKNRSFPANLSIQDQVEEAYAITHRKRLIGERNEALRAVRGKDGVNRDASTTHHDAKQSTKGPKMAAQDAAALKAHGFSLNQKEGRYEKKLKSGNIIVKDPKTGQTRLVQFKKP